MTRWGMGDGGWIHGGIPSSCAAIEQPMWEARFDDSQAAWYYFDPESSVSTWDRPLNYIPSPSDYETKYDPSNYNQPYYFDKTTGESTWSKPACLIQASSPAPPPIPPPAESTGKPMSLRDYMKEGRKAKQHQQPQVLVETDQPQRVVRPAPAPPPAQSSYDDASSSSTCAVHDCSGPISNGGFCKLHYEIHLLDVSERRRANSGFVGRCAAPRCETEMFKAGLCRQHYNEHQRNLVDHYQQGINEEIMKEEAANHSVKYSKEMMMLRKQAKWEEELRQRDADAKRAFEASQRERREAIERIKMRQAAGELEMPPAAPPAAPPSPPPAAPPSPPQAPPPAPPDRSEIDSLEAQLSAMKQKMAAMEMELSEEAAERSRLQSRMSAEREAVERARLEEMRLKDEIEREKGGEIDFLQQQLRDAERARAEAESNVIVNESEMTIWFDKQQQLAQQEEERLRAEVEKRGEAQGAEVDALKRQLKDAEAARFEAEKNVVVNEESMTIWFDQQQELEQQLLVFKEREEQENYNLKIAEALRKVEEEKRARLQLEGEERRKQMELELLRGKNKGRANAKGGSYGETG